MRNGSKAEKERYVCEKAHIRYFFYMIYGSIWFFVLLEPSHAKMSAPKCSVHSHSQHIEYDMWRFFRLTKSVGLVDWSVLPPSPALLRQLRLRMCEIVISRGVRWWEDRLVGWEMVRWWRELIRHSLDCHPPSLRLHCLISATLSHRTSLLLTVYIRLHTLRYVTYVYKLSLMGFRVQIKTPSRIGCRTVVLYYNKVYWISGWDQV